MSDSDDVDDNDDWTPYRLSLRENEANGKKLIYKKLKAKRNEMKLNWYEGRLNQAEQIIIMYFYLSFLWLYYALQSHTYTALITTTTKTDRRQFHYPFHWRSLLLHLFLLHSPTITIAIIVVVVYHWQCNNVISIDIFWLFLSIFIFVVRYLHSTLLPIHSSKCIEFVYRH